MKSSTKQFASAILALFVLVAALILFFELVQPAYSDLSVLKGQLAGQKKMLDTENSTIGQVQKLITKYQNQVSAQEAVAMALPMGVNLSGAIAQIYGLAQANGIVIQNTGISVMAQTAAATPTANVALNSGSPNLLLRPTGTIALALTANGNYESLFNFLSGLESNLRLFDIKQVSIQGGSAVKPGQDFFTYLITVNTYYQIP